jgi:hypothetical protein
MILHYSTQRGNQTAHLYKVVADSEWEHPEVQEAHMGLSRQRLAGLIFETWEVDVEELDEKPADMHIREWESLVKLDARQAD